MTQENDKHPKEPFNTAAKEPEFVVIFDSDMDDRLENDNEKPLRGNTDPKHEPKNVKKQGLTPTGSGPMFGRPRSPNQDQQYKQPEPVKGQPASEERQKELRNGNHTFEDEFNGLRVRTWRSDEPTKNGIQGGHINEMVVTDGEYGKEIELSHFKDGEWKKAAEATSERQAGQSAVEEYDGTYLKDKAQQEEQNRLQKKENANDKDKGKTR